MFRASGMCMAHLTKEEIVAGDWLTALRQRQLSLLKRVGLIWAIALVTAPMMGWRVSLGWAAAYCLLQGLEVTVLRSILRQGASAITPLRKAAICVVLFVSASAFGALSVPLWLDGGILGGLCAVMMLPAMVMFAMIDAPRSLALMLAGAAPPLLYLGATPFFVAGFGAPPAVVTTTAASMVLYGVYVVVGWRQSREATDERRRAHQAAETLQRKAEADLAAHTAFMAAVGHDLRTPIGAILTGAGELKVGDAQSRANASLIIDAGLMMKALLDDLLDHSKIGAGRMTIEAADFNLRAMLAQTLRLWRGPAEAKGLKLRVEGAARMPTAVRGDAMRLRQVLNNLMSNAMKFTSEGAITLRLDAWAEEPSGYSLLIEVADTGPGMRPDQLARLFTPFDQTAEGVSARHGGTGLGLAISRDLVELMGGRLTARSAPGEGARFTVSLFLPKGESAVVPQPAPMDESRRDIARALADRAPAPEPKPAPVVAETVPEPTPAPEPEPDAAGEEDEDRPLRLLVVDDHDINRRAVQLILQPLGCDIVTAADGLIALERCAESVFDVIFMDVRMPELDGRETTRRLRAGNGPNARTPVIAVTADTAPEDIAACQAAGMAYFVSKPLTPPALIGALQHVLNDVAETQETEAA